jgi:virulence-associated protein VapD
LESISTTYLANKYNRTNASITHILHDNGIEPVGLGDHNGLLWSPDAEDIIRKTVEEYDRQVNAKQYAKELNISYDNMKAILKQFGIKDTHKMYRSKKIEEYVKKMKKEQPKMTIEQLKILHPLVTDERCFNINYWPESMPKCFEDL